MCLPARPCAVVFAAVSLAALGVADSARNREAAAAGPVDALLVKVGGQSLPLVDAVRQAADDEQIKAYRELREEQSGTADGELEIAMWCRKQKLEEEERLHWWTLLAMAPDDADAIRALRLQR
jgi:hypothetical protein